MKTLLVLILSLLTWSATACECLPSSMGKNLQDADLVAEVEVVGFNDTLQIVPTKDRQLVEAYPPFTSGYAAQLRILNVFKGTVRKQMIALSNRQGCSNRYELGQKYVLFIYKRESRFYTKICQKNFVASDVKAMEQLSALLSQK